MNGQPEAASDSPAAMAAGWWEERQQLRPDAVWEVPFPPRPGDTARVLRQRAEPSTGNPEVWRAALFGPRAATAYIEVHSHAGPVGALVSLYEHVVPGGHAHAAGNEEETHTHP